MIQPQSFSNNAFLLQDSLYDKAQNCHQVDDRALVNHIYQHALNVYVHVLGTKGGNIQTVSKEAESLWWAP